MRGPLRVDKHPLLPCCTVRTENAKPHPHRLCKRFVLLFTWVVANLQKRVGVAAYGHVSLRSCWAKPHHTTASSQVLRIADVFRMHSCQALELGFALNNRTSGPEASSSLSSDSKRCSFDGSTCEVIHQARAHQATHNNF